MNKITAALIGAGNRGMDVYASYALNHPYEIKFVQVCEPNEKRRNKFCKLHNIPEENAFSNWEQLFEKPKIADVILICTQDSMHYKPTIKALELGYHVLLEKPMSNDPLECMDIAEISKKYNRILSVCHVLRYTPFFLKIKKLLDDKVIGDLVSIQHNENVGYWHQAHSYVRGNWNNKEKSSPMILSKSCHDMDIILWLANSNINKISSFGSLKHFKPENAPKGSTHRCLDGCEASDTCPFYAVKIYVDWKDEWQAENIRKIVCPSGSKEDLIDALKNGPYGRCVYYCDNNVVDHQVVNMEFDDGITCVFTMSAFTYYESRTIKLMGTKGEIGGNLMKNEIVVRDFLTGNCEKTLIRQQEIGHGGGDHEIMKNFIKLVQSDGSLDNKSSAEKSMLSHIMAFAAEESRLNSEVISIPNYLEKLRGKKINV